MSKTNTWLRSIALGAAAMLVLAGCGGGGSEPTEAPTTEPAATDVTTAETSEPAPPSAPATGGTDFDALEVGECLQFLEVPGATPDASGNIEVTHEVVDCNLAGQVKHLVTHSFDGPATCPNDDYTTYFQEGFLGNPSKSFCLAPVFEAGVSYGSDPINDYAPIDPADPNKYFTVESIIQGTDTTACPNQDWEHFSFPEPAPGTIYCLTD